MSLNPISLALEDKMLAADKSDGVLDTIETEEGAQKARAQRLVDKLRLHTVVKHLPSHKELALPFIINQINCAYEMGKLIEKNSSLIGIRVKRSMSVSERVVESATTVWDLFVLGVSYVFWQWIWPVITRIFVIGLVFHRVIADFVLQVLEWRARPDAAALKDISATAQQVDIRLQQFCYWPTQYVKLRQRKDDWESVTTYHAHYIRFYNSLWLVANDVIIGIALGSYIIDNANWVAYQINHILSGWTVEGLQRTISWLMDWPAGLKLNNELAAFLGDLFLWVIENWAGKIDFLSVCLVLTGQRASRISNPIFLISYTLSAAQASQVPACPSPFSRISFPSSRCTYTLSTLHQRASSIGNLRSSSRSSTSSAGRSGTSSATV